jgi:hypothetical protein
MTTYVTRITSHHQRCALAIDGIMLLQFCSPPPID